MKRRVLWTILLVPVLLITMYCIELAIPKRDYFIERTGNLQRVDVVASERDNGILETLRIESSTGLVVDARVRRPLDDSGKRYPIIVMIDGHVTGKDAVDLIGESAEVAFVAIDYPSDGSPGMRGVRQFLAAVPTIQKAFLDAPPALSLVHDWLLDQPWVDPQRVELGGISLGVPFAAVAGALDKRYSRVWLLHGGGDNVSWLMQAGRDEFKSATLRRILARIMLLLVYGNSFDTAKWIQEIAPRPLVLVAARGDDSVPPEAQLPFIEAAESEFVELIWTEGLHVHPERRNELQQVLGIIVPRIEAGT